MSQHEQTIQNELTQQIKSFENAVKSSELNLMMMFWSGIIIASAVFSGAIYLAYKYQIISFNVG
jgi:hypothetical protein